MTAREAGFSQKQTHRAAEDYIRRGLAPIPVPAGEKNPGRPGWPEERWSVEDVPKAWNNAQGVGILWGSPSGGLVDVDLDWPEAVAVAPHLLPDTKTFGREGSPHSHWIYRTTDKPPKTRRFKLPGEDDDRSVVELLSTGTQSLVPPSLHPCGERRVWYDERTAHEIDGDALSERVGDVATAALLARNYPGKGARHDYVLAATGYIGRNLAPERARRIMHAVIAISGDEEATGRLRDVEDTLGKIAAGRHTTGGPTLDQLAPGVYKQLGSWHGWGRERDEAESREEKEERRNQADRLIGYALEDVQGLFVDQHGAPHALVGGEPLPLNSRSYSWLRRLMWEHEGRTVNGEYLKTAAGTLAAHAEYSGKEHELHTRAAWHEGALYYELRPGRVVEVRAGEWRICEAPPVLFRRFPNLKPLPDPISAATDEDAATLAATENPAYLSGNGSSGSSGSISGYFLEKCLLLYANLKTERDRRLFVAYVVTLLLPHVGRPILSAGGVMGSGKTTLARLVKRLVDPTAPETVRLDPRDFLQKALHAFVVVLDNQNSIPEWAADTLCRLVTGEADSKRRLYTDDEDVIVELRRAVLLNGINVPTDRGDVLDRSLVVELERIPDNKRRTEEELWERFDVEHPRLLGAIFDVLAVAVKNKTSRKLSRRPRLADWGEYAAGVYEVFEWEEGEHKGAELFLADWDAIVRAQNQATLDGSPTAQAVIKFMEGLENEEYSASSSELHKKLEVEAERLGILKDKAWPRSASWLWRRIKEVQPLLAAVGIEATRKEEKTGTHISLRKLSEDAATAATKDENGVDKPKSGGSKGESAATDAATAATNAATAAATNPNERLWREHMASWEGEEF
jgi:hypothetical protein